MKKHLNSNIFSTFSPQYSHFCIELCPHQLQCGMQNMQHCLLYVFSCQIFAQHLPNASPDTIIKIPFISIFLYDYSREVLNVTSLVFPFYVVLFFTEINPWDSWGPSMNQGSGACLWTPVPQQCPAPCDRYKHASCAHRGHVYLLGGREKGSLRDFWKYNVGKSFDDCACYDAVYGF